MPSSPTIRLSSPAELVSVIPYLLGYHPRDSLVLVCATRGHIVLTACQPLLDSGAHPALDDLMSGIAQVDPDVVIVIGYLDAVEVHGAVVAAAAACTEVGVRVHDRVIVQEGAWRSLEDGTSGLVSAVPAASELVGAGIAPLPRRSDLDTLIAARPEAEDVARQLARYTARGGAGEDLLPLYCSAWPIVVDVTDDPPSITPKVAARAVLALTDVPVRDVLVARLAPGGLAPADVPGHTADLIRSLPPAPWETAQGWERAKVHSRLQHRLVALCAMTPDSHAAPPLAVLACWAWSRGDGALARAAIERALRCDSDYRLAQLIHLLITHHVRPPAA